MSTTCASVSTPKIPSSGMSGAAVLYATTIFWSAFLLFQVQPLISKFILPWFGGSPAVWTTCMLFFQSVLFAGYAYAHLVENRLHRTARLVVHGSLLLVAVVLLPIAPDAAWKPVDSGNPTWRILGLLAASVGVPYFVLSSTGPLVQSWFSRACPGRSPYRLYSLSNIGSMAALLSYPFVVEPALEVEHQAALWSWGFGLFAVLCGAGAVRNWSARGEIPLGQTSPAAESAAAYRPTTGKLAMAWVALPAFASLMLLATTNQVCQNVAVIPFLWVVPLALYLLSFIICFDHERWYQRAIFGPATAAIALLLAGLNVLPMRVGFMVEIALHFGLLLGVCMLCHGELVRLRPAPRRLTLYYLMISAGGALGGIFVSLVAPVIFTTFFEWPLGLCASFALAGALSVEPTRVALARLRVATRLATPLGWTGVAAGLAACVYCQQGSGRVHLMDSRNFYGEVSVVERSPEDPEEHDYALFSGGTIHGVQFVKPERRHEATTYYSPRSGVGQLLEKLAAEGRPPIRVGVVGLGVGTLARYARPGDEFRFYEINPEMLRVAETHFTYLKDCRGVHQTVLGDARLVLQREPPQRFDVLILDAFSGDSVPAHLLTREALAIYERHLGETGLLCCHITNTYLDLAPVVRGLARLGDRSALRIASSGDDHLSLHRADWMILGREAALRATGLSGAWEPLDSAPHILWTDGYSNLFRILK